MGQAAEDELFLILADGDVAFACHFPKKNIQALSNL